MSKSTFQIVETDEAGAVTSTYVYTTNDNSDSEDARIDTIPQSNPRKTWKSLLDVFLPAGYPHSVTEDYLQYRIYDSLQAFSSSIAGLLASRAVLEGVGVGDASASATAALFLSIVQDSMGRIATILFAHRLGTSVEPECKKYRLLADIFNDAAMILDCLSPAFPKTMRVVVLATGSVLRSLCGVAAGSSKASLSAHFARWGNLGELNAKDSSQETVISLLGMLVGCLVVKMTNSTIATWSTLLLLLSVHLATNHAAVRSVCMRTLNRQRANIVFSHRRKFGEILTPEEVSIRERVFEHDGVLRSADGISGYCRIGVSMTELLQRIGNTHRVSGSTNIRRDRLTRLVETFRSEAYLLYRDNTSPTALILLKKGSDASVQLKAWYHALMLAMRMTQETKTDDDKEIVLEATQSTLAVVRGDWESLLAGLTSAGWDLKTTALETRSGTRVHIEI